MKSSRWIIIVVLLLVVGVVIAKQARRPQEQPAPVTEAQALPPVAPAEEAPPAAPEEKPQAVASASPAPPERPADPPKAPAVEPSQPEPTPPPPAPPAPEPAPEGPLPGSQLDASLKNGRPTLADFGMGTCKPCQAMAPILKAATRDYWGKANIVFVELDKYPELARKYGIAVMPTQIFFDASGAQVETHMGYMDRAGIDGRLTTLGAQP